MADGGNERDKQYAKIVIDFVNNDHNIVEAIFQLAENIESTFGFTPGFADKVKKYGPGSKVAANEDDKFEILGNDFIRILPEQMKYVLETLSSSDEDGSKQTVVDFILEFYLRFYNEGCRPIYTVNEGRILPSFPLAESNFFRAGDGESCHVRTVKLYYAVIYCLIELLKNESNRERIRKCTRCQRFFFASRLDNRIQKCKQCSSKSTLSKDQRKLYQQEYRAKKKKDREDQKREQRIRKIIDAGFTREDAIEMIEADSKM